jgi:leader peptidase (prepilin peptidase)/N-methyltransferase
MRLPTAIWCAAFGAVVGSFLNVVIARLPRGESVVRPRSRCPRCGTPIAWFDNLPIVSWILLRARCRACRERISVRYPLVEALGAAAAWLAWQRHGLSAAAAAELCFVALVLALAFIDIDTWLLPHALTWPLIGLGLAASALGLGRAGLMDSLSGAGLGFAAFAAVAVVGERIFRKEALGFGDVWFLAGLGAWLGMKALLPMVLLASLQGSVVGIALVLLGRSAPGPREPPVPLPAPSPAPSPSPTQPPTATPITTAPPTPTVATTMAQPSTSSLAADEDWVPPRHAVPFGPFLALGALEWLYLSGALARLAPVLRIFR